MKVAILITVVVVAMLAVAPSSGSPHSRKQQKRAVAPWVATANFWINMGLGFVPNGKPLQNAIDGIVTAAGTTPFSISSLLTSIFNTVTAAVKMSGANSAVTTNLGNLFTAITTLVSDACSGKTAAVLNTDITNVVCAAEKLAGLTTCNSAPLSTSITKLVSDATSHAAPDTIVQDAFAIVTAAINLGAKSGKVPPATISAVQTLITNICTLVVDCVTGNTGALGGAITSVVTAASNPAL